MDIYVGNLSYSCDAAMLQALFEPFGEVLSTRIATDRLSGLSKGFGFVQMREGSEGEKAIATLDGEALLGRPLRVCRAKPCAPHARQMPTDERIDPGGGRCARY